MTCSCCQIVPHENDDAVTKGVNTILTDVAVYIMAGILGAVAGIAINEVLRRRSLGSRRSQAEEQARALVQGAGRGADNLVREAKLEAKDLLLQARTGPGKGEKEKSSGV